MTNILTILPDFDVSPYTHLLPSLEKAVISTADLLTLDALDVAKRAQVPPTEVKKLAHALQDALHADIASAKGPSLPRNANLDGWEGLQTGQDLADRWTTISTLDDTLDSALGGGIAVGHLTEIVGESAVGKTQFLLSLLLSAQLSSSSPASSAPQKKSALYISTEAPLQTTRLTQILESHPRLASLPIQDRPSLSRVHSTHIHDVEAQEHIIRFQAPVAIQKNNVGLLIIDSVAANYRAEFDKGGQSRKSSAALAKRSAQVAQLGALLRDIARDHNIAVVVANQVADRFTTIEPSLHLPSQSTQGTRSGSPAQPPSLPNKASSQPTGHSLLSTDDPLALDHQQRFFTGWGDDISVTNLKTPSLGLTWTNQLSTRIALLKESVYEDRAYMAGEDRNVVGWKRTCKVVFSAWCAEGKVPFEIWEGGVRTATAPEE